MSSPGAVAHTVYKRKEMAVTHADLEVQRRRRNLGGKAGTAVMVLCVFCGLLGFVFCILAENYRSRASWILLMSQGGKERYECVYSGNGKIALLSGAGGFVTVAVAMIIHHAYMWLALVGGKSSRAGSVGLRIWDINSSSTGLLAKRAALLFLSSWVCFGVAEVLLVIGVAVESNHLRGWKEVRKQCLVVRHGSFLAAGIFDLCTVFLATAFYFAVLRMQRVRDSESAVQREVVEAALFSAPETTLSDTLSSTPISAADLEVVEEPSTRDRNEDFVKLSSSG